MVSTSTSVELSVVSTATVVSMISVLSSSLGTFGLRVVVVASTSCGTIAAVETSIVISSSALVVSSFLATVVVSSSASATVVLSSVTSPVVDVSSTASVVVVSDSSTPSVVVPSVVLTSSWAVVS